MTLATHTGILSSVPSTTPPGIASAGTQCSSTARYRYQSVLLGGLCPPNPLPKGLVPLESLLALWNHAHSWERGILFPLCIPCVYRIISIRNPLPRSIGWGFLLAKIPEAFPSDESSLGMRRGHDPFLHRIARLCQAREKFSII